MGMTGREVAAWARSSRKPKRMTAEELLATHEERVLTGRARGWTTPAMPVPQHDDSPMPTALEYLTAWRRL